MLKDKYNTQPLTSPDETKQSMVVQKRRNILSLAQPPP